MRNSNPVGINVMAFRVGKIHFFDHQNRYLLRVLYTIFLLRSPFLFFGFIHCLSSVEGKTYYGLLF